MNRFAAILVSAIAILPGCDAPDLLAPQVKCASWDACLDGLAIEWEILDGGFSRQRQEFLVPGDSILVRISAFNRSNLPLDSVTILGNAVGTLGTSVQFTNLRPGERRQATNTMVVGGYTFDSPFGFRFEAYTGVSDDFDIEYIDVVVTARSAFPRIARSGYEFEVMNILGPTVPIRYRGREYSAAKIQHKTQTGILGLISNPYDLPTVPVGIGACIYDIDHCFLQFEGAAKTQSIPAGGSEYLELMFLLDTNGRYFEWWAQMPFWLSVCAEHSFSGRDCAGQFVLITANFEADCVVTTIPLGTPVNDSVPECGRWKTGSAYRFEAKKGQRYTVRMLAGTGNAFLSGPEGVYIEDARPASLAVPSDGTYYVAVWHQSPVQFQLDRLE